MSTGAPEAPLLGKELLSDRLTQRLHQIDSFTRFREMLQRFPGVDFFLYGGALRDEVLGRTPQGPFDLDIIACTASLDGLAADLKGDGAVDFGRLFGNLRWTPEGAGTVTYDFQALAKYNLSNPCRNVVEILHQVDFTGNALAFNLRTGEIMDPLDGLGDLNLRIMRAVRFDREPLRIPGLDLPLPATVWFRILHFASVLDLRIERQTAKWIAEHSDYLAYEPHFRKQFFAPCLAVLEGL